MKHFGVPGKLPVFVDAADAVERARTAGDAFAARAGLRTDGDVGALEERPQ